MLEPDYQAALDYIFNYVDYERRRSVPYTEAAWNLERTRQVLAALDNPHRVLRFVHVAGSKGKGSTAANIEAVLRASGLRTGFYTSPHLHTFRERIRVDGQLISPKEVVWLLGRCKPAIEAVPGITTFEIMTVLALLHFARQGVDWVVLEVGLGGRLDATNVVTPAVSVITPISLEHTALLGDTLADIAREKAGIIKPGVPVVIAPQKPEAQAVFDAVARSQAAPLIQVGADWTWQSVSNRVSGQLFSVRSEGSPWDAEDLEGLYTPLLGSHQLSNATTAIAACAALVAQRAPITGSTLRDGLAHVVWPGRLEVLTGPAPGRRTLVLDSAHTDASAQLLHSALAAYFPARPVTLVLGVSNDKDAAGILAALLPDVQRLIVTRSRHPRAADPLTLATLAANWLSATQIVDAPDVAAALDMALAQTPAEGIVCLTGSMFIVGEGREAWLARFPHVLPANDWAHQAEPPGTGWQVTQTLNATAGKEVLP